MNKTDQIIKVNATKAAELIARRFRSAGFPKADIQIIGPQPTNKNFVVRHHGIGVKPPVVLLAHLGEKGRFRRGAAGTTAIRVGSDEMRLEVTLTHGS